ncbi:MAG: iron uptake porin, partial [Cyanobacteria bacterium J06628_3]
DVEDETTFGYRTRLNISSSFTGNDKLRIQLEEKNLGTYGNDRTGTEMTRIDKEDSNFSYNNLGISKLNYDFKPSKNINASVWATGAGMDDFLDADKAKVQTTRFAKRNPLIHRSAYEDQGIGATIKFNKNANLQLGYTVDGGNNVGDSTAASAGQGLFGRYSAGVQANFKVSGVKLAASYVNSYGTGENFSNGTGSALASQIGSDKVSTDAWGVQASTKLGKKTKIGAWYGNSTSNDKLSADEITLENWAVFASIKDFAKKGNVLGVTFGMPPKVTGASGTSTTDNASLKGTSYLLDVTYRHKVTDRLSIQPGFFAVFNPEHNSDNDTIYGAVLNTTFKF